MLEHVTVAELEVGQSVAWYGEYYTITAIKYIDSIQKFVIRGENNLSKMKIEKAPTDIIVKIR